MKLFTLIHRVKSNCQTYSAFWPEITYKMKFWGSGAE